MSSSATARNSHQKREIKRKLASKHGCFCQICKRPFPLHLLTIDHIIALCFGGTWDIWNLQLACSRCNQEKSKNEKDPWAIFDK